MVRSNAYLKELRTDIFRERWSETYIRSVYRWAGHVARLSLHDPQRLTLHVLYYQKLRLDPKPERKREPRTWTQTKDLEMGDQLV